MKEIKVIVLDKNRLQLQEDAKAGDIIDLSNLIEVDTSKIEELINDNKEILFAKKLKERELELQKINEGIIQRQIAELKSSYEVKVTKLNGDIEAIKNLKKAELEMTVAKYIAEIHDLKQKMIHLESSKNNEIELGISKASTQIKEKSDEEITKLRIDLAKKDLEIQNIITEYTNKMKELNAEKQKVIDDLTHAKSANNIKNIGEDLEVWCDREMISYQQTGFLNCTWYKDTKVVSSVDSTSGTKADFIFKIFADNNCNEESLLTSVCLEMKDEDPSSVNKKKNSDHYKRLDENRKKKGCKYALLVSTLEADKANDLPIYKVREYDDMYVVRPQYMITFLNMLVTLHQKFARFILDEAKEMLDIAAQKTFESEFESLKKTYLDNPLSLLEKAVAKITDLNKNIREASKSIDDEIYKIQASYIEKIYAKLDKFETDILKRYKKLNKESNKEY